MSETQQPSLDDVGVALDQDLTQRETLALVFLLDRGIDFAREDGLDDLASLGDELVDELFGHTESNLAHGVKFQREYLEDQ